MKSILRNSPVKSQRSPDESPVKITVNYLGEEFEVNKYSPLDDEKDSIKQSEPSSIISYIPIESE